MLNDEEIMIFFLDIYSVLTWPMHCPGEENNLFRENIYKIITLKPHNSDNKHINDDSNYNSGIYKC